MILASNTPRNVAILIAVILVIGWLVYLLVNMRQGTKEVGAELELAPNRKPYYADEALEGPRLERFQMAGFLLLAGIVIALPLYWLFEPGRQAGATKGEEERLAEWGGELFKPTAEGGFNCAGCHGGMAATGGVASYTLTDPNTGEVSVVPWKAPSLDTVFYRYTDDEVRYILVYGRPYSPMSPWGLDGGGPLNDQQIDSLIAYLHSIQVPMEGCPDEDPLCGDQLPKDRQTEIQAEIDKALADGTASSVGEAIYNLELASGAYSCARCHTRGWSYGDPQVTGGGAMGPNLTGGSEVRQFPSFDDQVQFIAEPPDAGKRYGAQGQSSGRMPAFGKYYTEEQLRELVSYLRSL